jgi:hypothetical protein
MRKVLTLQHVHSTESYNVDSVDQIKQDVATMLNNFDVAESDNMICVVIRRKAPDGTFRISAGAFADIDAEEIRINDGAIDKLIIQGRE